MHQHYQMVEQNNSDHFPLWLWLYSIVHIQDVHKLYSYSIHGYLRFCLEQNNKSRYFNICFQYNPIQMRHHS